MLLVLLAALIVSAVFSFSFDGVNGVAYAVAPTFADGIPESYQTYLDSITGDKDWYFGADYLNLEAVFDVIQGWKSNTDYDFSALADDPIIIAVIDSGISHAYYIDENDDYVQAAVSSYYSTEYATTVDGTPYTADYEYRINPVIESVLLKDADGNYVYGCYADYNQRKSVSGSTMSSVARDKTVQTAAYDLADTADDHHGTHVTGTAALLIHMLGLEDYVKILPIKANAYVKPSSAGAKSTACYTWDDLNTAVDYAVDCGADVVSMSLSVASTSYNYSSYVDKTVIVAAAGNSGTSATAYYPAAASGVIGVMNYMNSDDGAVLSTKSNYGAAYDIAAPGYNIISCIDGVDGYGTLTGTSMSTPVTAAACALSMLRYRAYKITADITLTNKMMTSMLTLSAGQTADVGTKKSPTLNLLGLAETDFFNEEVFGDEMYVDMEGVAVSSESSSSQILGELTDITCTVKFLPTNSRTDDTVYWWYQSGGRNVELGTGNSITFTPPSTVGTYAVYCKLVDGTGADGFICDGENSFVFTVKYKVLNATNSYISTVSGTNENNQVAEGEGVTLKIDGINSVDPTKRNVVWYVNGEAVSTDVDFYFAPFESGNYEIYATVNGIKVGVEITVGVCYYEAENGLTTDQIVLFCILSALAAAWITALGAKLVRAKRK